MCFEITGLRGIDGKLFLKQPQSKFYQMAEEKNKTALSEKLGK